MDFGRAALGPCLLVLPITPLKALGAETIEVRPHPDWIIAANHRVWVTGIDAGVGVFEPRTGARIGSVAIEGELCAAPDAGFSAVWFPTCSPSAIHRVDVHSLEVVSSTPVELPAVGEFTIGASEGGVWAVLNERDGSSRLGVIDPTPDRTRVVREIEIPAGATSVRAGHGSLWVAYADERHVLRIDPERGVVTGEFETGRGPRFLVTGEDGVWVLNQESGSVTHIDSGSDTVVATVDVDHGPMRGGDIAVGEGSVWVRGSKEMIARIDPSTHTVVARYGEPTVGSASVAATDGMLWASAGAEGLLFRIPLDR